MKNSIVTFGLFTLVMVLTSFTTPTDNVGGRSEIKTDYTSNVGGRSEIKTDYTSNVGGRSEIKTD
jgi:hypothetical protein